MNSTKLAGCHHDGKQHGHGYGHGRHLYISSMRKISMPISLNIHDWYFFGDKKGLSSWSPRYGTCWNWDRKGLVKMRMPVFHIIRIFPHAYQIQYLQLKWKQDKNLDESRSVVVNSQCHICHIEYYLHILPANETIKVLNKKTHITSLGRWTFLETSLINELGIKSRDWPN